LNIINENIDTELEELMELENELVKIRNGIDKSKIEIKTDTEKSIELESPSNKRQKVIAKATVNPKTPLHSVTIDLNSTTYGNKNK